MDFNWILKRDLLSATKVFKSEFQVIAMNICLIHSARSILQEIQMNDFTLEVLLLCILTAETLSKKGIYLGLCRWLKPRICLYWWIHLRKLRQVKLFQNFSHISFGTQPQPPPTSPFIFSYIVRPPININQTWHINLQVKTSKTKRNTCRLFRNKILLVTMASWRECSFCLFGEKVFTKVIQIARLWLRQLHLYT